MFIKTKVFFNFIYLYVIIYLIRHFGGIPMIKKIHNIFKIDTLNTSYIIRISKYGHILNDFYGAKIIDENIFEFSK